jgi:hypothetical protein
MFKNLMWISLTILFLTMAWKIHDGEVLYCHNFIDHSNFASGFQFTDYGHRVAELINHDEILTNTVAQELEFEKSIVKESK